MMLSRVSSAHPTGLFLLSLTVCLSMAYTPPRNISNFPRPGPSTRRQCGGSEIKSYICDPDKLLNTRQPPFKRLQWEMQRLRETTPCFCSGCSHTTFSHRTLVMGIAVAERIYMPPNVTNKNLYLRSVANSLRLKWSLGQCSGSANSALMLYERSSDQLIYSFGSMVSARLGARCTHWIESHPVMMFMNLESRLVLAVNVIRNAVRNPCCGRSCLYLNDNWYRMLAWVVGGVVIFSALTFFGRRVCARNMYVRSRVRSAATGHAYPPVGLFGARPRCSRSGRSDSSGVTGRDSGHRSRSTPGAVLDSDLDLPPAAGGHVLYSTTAPPPYPGMSPGPLPVQMAPPYVGKPPAYDEIEREIERGEAEAQLPPPPPAVEPNAEGSGQEQEAATGPPARRM